MQEAKEHKQNIQNSQNNNMDTISMNHKKIFLRQDQIFESIATVFFSFSDETIICLQSQKDLNVDVFNLWASSQIFIPFLQLQI